jgi:polysaccharide chain length determinant protein (PEP-CTERM system associated)
VLPGKKYTPEEVLRILYRHKWLLIVPFAIACTSAAVIAQRMPSIYKSETLIQVIPQRIPESYVRSTVTTRLADRLGAIQQTILSRSHLERIIKDFNLYPEERKVAVMEDVVTRMRERDVDVRVERGDAFSVSFVSGDPRIAQRVAERLGSLFIDEYLRDREVLAEQTSQFLEGQLEDAKRRLLEHEKKLEEYRSRYADELPPQIQSNLQAIQNAQNQLQSLAQGMSHDRERRLLIERQLADLEANEMAAAPIPPAAPAGDAPSATTADQLEAAVTVRRNLLLRFTADHPDVITISRRIATLEEKLRAEAAAAPVAPGVKPKPVSAAELIRQNRIRDLRASLEDIDREFAAKRAAEEQLRIAIQGYQAKVAAGPRRESELIELTRDYSTIQSVYSDLLSKREASKLAANVERQQIGEQFKILDPARVPERPFSPNRTRIIGLGSVIGLAFGLALIALLEYRDSTFKSEDEIRQILQLPVLALVPLMASDRQRRAQRRRRLVVAVAAMVLVLGSVGVLAFWKMHAS